METSALPPYALMCRMRTARQKKRAQKEDREKQLIQLDKLQRSLRQARRDLPMVPLDEPYQRGWKRTFVLRADVQRSSRAAFYESLLHKINTVAYCPEKAFTRKKRKYRKKVPVPIPQELKAFTEWEWRSPRTKLTDAERICFHAELRWTQREAYIYFVFSEPWRYQLKVMPNMITEVKMVDPELEQQEARLDNYLDRNHLRCRMERLTQGWSQYRGGRPAVKPKEQNPFKNKPLHAILAECDEQQNTN